MTRYDHLATPWSTTGLPVPDLPVVDGPPPLARVDVTPRAAVPMQRGWPAIPDPWLMVR